MKEFEQYRDTGILGGYQPEQVIGRQCENGKVMPIFRDAYCTVERNGIELCRKMMIGSRVFTVRSIFNSKSEKTATDKLLHMIDDDLSK